MGFFHYCKIILLNYLIIVLFYSCSAFNKKTLNNSIRENKWSGEDVLFSEVSSHMSKQNYINRGWTRFGKNKSIPYFLLKKEKATILGNYQDSHSEYLVLQLKNGRKYKWKNFNWQLNGKALPSHLCRLKILKEAEKLNGDFIWLNSVTNDTSFINMSTTNIYNKFDKVKIIGTRVYQNGGRDWPIWLVIDSVDEYNSMVRYNGIKKKSGKQNYYYETNPLPKIWGREMITKIIAGEISYGMSKEQVRVSKGNPDIIINTSSRHNVSEQWIYGNQIGEKQYLSFEYGKLITM